MTQFQIDPEFPPAAVANRSSCLVCTVIAPEDIEHNRKTVVVVENFPQDIRHFETSHDIGVELEQLKNDYSGPYVLDLGGLIGHGGAAEFISSLLTLHRRSVEAGDGPLNLCGTENSLQQILQRMGLTKLFKMFPDRETALAELGFGDAKFDFPATDRLSAARNQALTDAWARHFMVNLPHREPSRPPLPDDAVQIISSGDRCTVKINADVIAESSRDSELVISKIMDAAGSHSCVNVDLSSVLQFGADSIGALISAQKLLGGGLTVSGLNDNLKNKFAQLQVLEYLTGNAAKGKAA